MINIKLFHVTQLATNCCYLLDDETGACAVSDPGDRSPLLEAEIEKNGGRLDFVLLTHGHYDHICYAKKLAEKYGAKIVTGKHNAEFLHDTNLNGTARHLLSFEPFEADLLLDDGQTFMLGNTPVKYLYTPGHTSGCGVFIFDDIMICGDVLFRESYGRTDLPSGDDYQMIQSLKRLKELDGDFTVIPGHGPLTSLGHERRFNPLMSRL